MSASTVLGYLVSTGSVEMAALYPLSQRAEAVNAAKRWGATIVPLAAHAGRIEDAPVCPWCDRQGYDICQHADEARTCQR